jgi:hypothetical protein
MYAQVGTRAAILHKSAQYCPLPPIFHGKRRIKPSNLYNDRDLVYLGASITTYDDALSFNYTYIKYLKKAAS